ncbi:MAG: dockerin type I domain-containing protein, partial [Planctomycetota bacterium]
MLSAIPFGAAPDDTCEYMLGDVSVTLVLMESDGSIDPSTEDWTTTDIESVKGKVAEGLSWWEDALALESSVHSLNFILDATYADSPVPTGYEPISRPWDAYQFWVEDFLDHVGFSTVAGLGEDIRSFNHAQRLAQGTDWSFTIFVANSTNDTNDRFELGHEFSGAFGFAGGLFF